MASAKTRPKRPTAAEARKAKGEQLLACLHEARAGDTYPLTVRQLAARWGGQPEEALKLLTSKDLKHAVSMASKKTLEAPLVLAEDLHQLAQSELFLRFCLSEVRASRLAKSKQNS